MNCEANRLQTFHNWPANSAVSASRIAKAGFYYTGRAQEVQCFLCRAKVTEWNYGDQAMTLHRVANPECPFVLDPASTCNVPLISVSQAGNTSVLANSGIGNHSNESAAIKSVSNLYTYSKRLSTFQGWPIPFIVSPERLAKSGFFYLQNKDMVQCVYCQGVVLTWESGDDPYVEHRMHFPQCDFYLKVELEEDLSAERVDLGNVKLMPGTTSSISELGIQQHSAPKQLKHAAYEGRLRTFQNWPSNLKQTPEMLADAGFYYIGSEDQVRCYHCDGGLRNWEETDDAWIEHAKWFPKCGYVALVRGQDFIKQCIENRPPLDPEILASVPDDNADNSITPPVSPAIVPQPQTTRHVSDAELEVLLGTAPAMAALQIGLHVGRVKMALKRRMEQTGLPYANADRLIQDATRIQLSEEDNVANRQTPDPSSTELGQLLLQILSSAEASTSSSAPTENMDNSEKQLPLVPRRRRPPRFVEAESQVEEKDIKGDKTLSLEEENRKLKEARLCKICMDREVAVVFLPCSHLSTCVFCAPSLTHCPMCRQEIRATVRTFLA